MSKIRIQKGDKIREIGEKAFKASTLGDQGWKVVSGKTASLPKPDSASELVEKIKVSADIDFVKSLLEDGRKTVKEAAAARIEQLEAEGNAGNE